MTSEKLKELQQSMSDEELLKEVDRLITSLCETGGRSFIMCVPPEVSDSDMLLSELVRRYRKTLNNR